VSGNITKAPLQVATETAHDKVYDGTTAAVLTGGSLNGLVASDVGLVTIQTEKGVFASPNVGTGIAVTSADIITGTAAGNYNLIQETGMSANITPATLNVLGVNNQVANSKTYDGTTNAKLVSGQLSCYPNCVGVSLVQSGFFNSPDVNYDALGHVIPVGVTATDTLSGTNKGNYTLIEPTGLSALINPKAVTISGIRGTTKVYDTSVLDPLTITTTSGLPTISGLIGTQTLTVTNDLFGTLAHPDAGSQAITVNLGLADGASTSANPGKAGNYYLKAQPTLSNVTVKPEPITVTSTVDNKTYDGTTVGSATPLIYNDATHLGVLYGTDSLTGGTYTFSSANVGTRTLKISGVTVLGNSGDYIISYHNTTNDVISKALLFYLADPKAFLPGVTPSGLSGHMVGFVNNETVAVLSGTPKWTTTATKTSPAGSYAIKGSGYSSGNYQLLQAGSNSTALCISATLNCASVIVAEQIRPGTRNAGLSTDGFSEVNVTAPMPVLTELETQPAFMDTGKELKPRLPGLEIKGGGVKLPDEVLAMN